MIKKFHYSPLFEKNLRRLERDTRLEVIEELDSFAENPNQPQFRIHPLKEKFGGWLSLTVASDLLIIFKFAGPDQSEVILYDIGAHEIYK